MNKPFAFLWPALLVLLFSCGNADRQHKTATGMQLDTLKTVAPIQLEKWYGVYLNTDIGKLTSYKGIIQRIGWYKLFIASDKITFECDKRMETDFPTEAPGGVVVKYKCDYHFSGDTLKLYKKKEGDNAAPEEISKTGSDPVLVLYKKNWKYYGLSEDIALSENMVNAIRVKSGPPYLFVKFNNNATIGRPWFGSYNMIVDCGVRDGQHAEWVLNIAITRDSIIATGKGYETNFNDVLTAIADAADTLILNHQKHPYGFDGGGEKMHPEFILIRSNGKYFVQSGWLDSDENMTEKQPLGFAIEKN